jgi:hypothetical protein
MNDREIHRSLNNTIFNSLIDETNLFRFRISQFVTDKILADNWMGQFPVIRKINPDSENLEFVVNGTLLRVTELKVIKDDASIKKVFLMYDGGKSFFTLELLRIEQLLSLYKYIIDNE